MDHRQLLNNHTEISTHGRSTVNQSLHKDDPLDSLFANDPRINPSVNPSPSAAKLSSEALKIEPGVDGQLTGIQTSSCGPATMASLPINALNSGEKINLQMSDLENIPMINGLDGRAVELQPLAGGNQALQGVQMVKLTFINCGDQQTILLTTPSGPFEGLEQSSEGLTINIPEQLLGGGDLNLGGLSVAPSIATSAPIQANATDSNAPGSSKTTNYAVLNPLPPITSGTDKLCAEKLPTVAPTMLDVSQNYSLQDLAPFITSNGDKTKFFDKTLANAAVFQANASDLLSAGTVPITLNLQGDSSIPLVDFPTTELKLVKPLSPGMLGFKKIYFIFRTINRLIYT